MEWRRLHNEELNDLYSSPNITRVDQSKKNEMGGARSTYGGRGEVHTGFWWGNLRESDNLGDTGIGGRIILKWMFRKSAGSRDWIDLAQSRDRWRGLVNAVMNGVP